MKSATIAQARAAKASALKIFESLVPVVGVGITKQNGGFGVKVNLRRAPPIGKQLPASIDGVPLTVEVVGPIRKRPNP